MHNLQIARGQGPEYIVLNEASGFGDAICDAFFLRFNPESQHFICKLISDNFKPDDLTSRSHCNGGLPAK